MGPTRVTVNEVMKYTLAMFETYLILSFITEIGELSEVAPIGRFHEALESLAGTDYSDFL